MVLYLPPQPFFLHCTALNKEAWPFNMDCGHTVHNELLWYLNNVSF